jgi:DNA-binding transcriptional regulator YdaS (Cro superfamily)
MDTILQHKTPSRRALEAAIEWAGGQSALARKIGAKQQNVWRYLQSNRVPAEFAVLVEEKTDGEFKREQFRPDLWPEGWRDGGDGEA